jgi:hypothetical protein
MHRIIPIVLLILLAGCNTTKTEPGFVSLFNGRNFDGWTGDTNGYVVKDGEIQSRVPEPGEHIGNLFTAGEYDNFILRFQFKLAPGANNGLGIRSPLVGDAAFACCRVQGATVRSPAREYNQIASQTLVEWSDNADISDKSPADYAPKYEAKIPEECRSSALEAHALPSSWWDLDYVEFLQARRTLMSGVVKKAFELLAG